MRYLMFFIFILISNNLLAQTTLVDDKTLNRNKSHLIGGVSYSARTDLLDDIKPRLYTNVLSVYGGYLLTNNTTFFASATGIYESSSGRGGEVQFDENERELFLNDFAISLRHNFNFIQGRSLSFTIANEFPTSADSRREGYRSVSYLSGTYLEPFLNNRLFTLLTVQGNYIWNTYEFSPATNLLNKTGGLIFSAGFLWFFWQRLYLSGSIGTQFSQYADSTADQTYRNSAGVGYRDGQLVINFSYTNGTYLDDNEANFWYIDDHRKIVQLSLAYNF